MRRGATGKDIRSPAELRDELVASEARFRDVIERNADAIVVVDGNGEVLYANPMAERLFGRAGEDLVGSPLGFPVVAGETTELDVLTQAGPRVAEMRVVPSMWDGERAYIASLRDITVRKEAERDAQRLIREQGAREAAEELANRQRFLLDGSARLSASLDYDAVLRTLAELCITGVADWAVVFCSGDHGHPERVEVAHRDEAALARVSAEELMRLCRDGREAELRRELGAESLLHVPMTARGKQVGGLVLLRTADSPEFIDADRALAEDIAARGALALDNASLYEEARKADRARSDLLAVVSHDLRTPLTAIVGYTDLLSMGIPHVLPDESATQVERIRKSAQHLMYLMNELLTFTRLDAGHEKLHLREVDVREVVREVASVMEPAAMARGLRLETSLPLQPLTLRTDPDKLRQILLNLAGNAVKYTSHGSVKLSLHAAHAAAVIEVQDTGVGIGAEDLAKIYEPFWQVDTSQRSKDGGTGLGLSIVRRMIDLLGGDVSVESTLGEGTTFTVRVPSV